MEVKYNKKAFDQIKNKLEVIKKLQSEEVRNKIANEIAEQGAEFAKQLYVEEPVIVSATPAVDGKAQIIANGDQVAYTEFGTGEYAKGTYEGKLPTTGVPITGSWQYYYPSKSKAKGNGGTLGWYHHKKFHVGRKAGSQMWKTAIELRKNALQIAKQVIKKELEGK